MNGTRKTKQEEMITKLEAAIAELQSLLRSYRDYTRLPIPVQICIELNPTPGAAIIADELIALTERDMSLSTDEATEEVLQCFDKGLLNTDGHTIETTPKAQELVTKLAELMTGYMNHGA